MKAHSVTGRSAAIEAFQQERWEDAVELLTPVVANDMHDRECGLMLSSALLRNKDKRSATAVVGAIEYFTPSQSYDSRAAHGTHPDFPYERDLVTNFLVENIEEIRRNAASFPRAKQRSKRQYAFVYWDTEDLPPLVKAARKSVLRHLGDDFELVELNDQTLSDWVKLSPEAIQAAKSTANLSDLIRLELLGQHGGLWIDATCLLTGDFTDFMREMANTDFFLFTYAGSRTGSWFWWTKQSSYRLQLLRAALNLWISKVGIWTNYFMFHDFVEMLYWVDKQYRLEWDAGFKRHPREALALLGRLTKEVSDIEWNRLYKASPVHKLSWKYNSAAEEHPSTVVSRVISGEEVLR